MKYFTERLSFKQLPLLLCLFSFNLLFIGEVSSQCTVSPPTDTIVLLLDQDGEGLLSPDFVESVVPNGGCTTPFNIYKDAAGTIELDNGMTPTITDTLFTCTAVGISYTFFTASTDGSTRSSVVPFTIMVVDNTPPKLVVTPRNRMLDCLFKPKLAGVDNPDSITFSGFMLTENCGGQVVDTTYTDKSLAITQGDTVDVIQRIWTITTMNDGIATDTQFIHIVDNIDPFWDTTATTTLVSTDSSYFTNDSTLFVLIDTSSIAGRARYDFYQDTLQFKPIAVDSCLGAVDTITPYFVSSDTMNMAAVPCADTINLVYNAIDAKGNLTGSGSGRGNFTLSLIIADTTAPMVIQEPFNGVVGMIDTFVVNVDSAACNVTIDSADIRIVVRDSISKDDVEYEWRIDSLDASYMVYNSGVAFPKNSGVWSVTNNDVPGDFNAGIYQITYRYRDICMNVDSSIFILDVRTVAPVVVAPVSPITLFNDPDTCGAVAAATDLMITATDGFDNDGIVYSWKRKTISGVQLLAADGLESNNDASLFADSLFQIEAFFPVGQHEVTYFFQDTSACSTLDSIKLTLIVQDTSGGMITYDPFGSDDTLVNNVNVLTTFADPGECSDQLNFDEPISADFTNCGLMTGSTNTIIERKLVSSPNPNIFSSIFGAPNGGSIDRDFPVGETIFRYIFTDSIGNSDSISFNITVLDTLAPQITCRNITITLDRDGVDTISPSVLIASMTDNCLPLDTFFISQDTFSCADIGVKNVTVTARDASGNTTTCVAQVTVDFVPIPNMTSLPSAILDCNEVVVPAPTALDDCDSTIVGTPSIPLTPDNSTSPPSYTFTNSGTINWAFTDSDGNTVFQSQQIILSPDVTAPTANCQPDTVSVSVDSMGMIAVIKGSDLNNGSTDNCTDVADLIYTVSLDTVPCDSMGKVFPVELYVTDEEGNSDTCTAMVTIVDDLAPVFQNVPTDTTLNCDATIPSQPTLMAIENCGGAIDSMSMFSRSTRVMVDTSTGGTLRPDTMAGFYNYTITNVWVAGDTNGNLDSVKQIITVQDTTPPVVDYPDTLLVGSAADATTCSALVTLDLGSKVQDACAPTLKYRAIADANGDVQNDSSASISLTVPMGDTTVSIIAEDYAGNMVDQKLVIVVDDRTAPRPVCANAVSVTINPLGYVKIQPSDIDLNSSDNCTDIADLSFTLSRDSFTCADVGQTFTVVMTVTDQAGFSAGCPSQVSIEDFAGSGTFSCPGDVTIDCNASIAPEDLGFPTVVDVCGDSSALSFRDTIVAGGGGACRIIQRTWTAVDTFGNATSCVQMINLLDTVPPTLAVIYKDTIVDCIGKAITADSVMVMDNCAATFMVGAVDVTTVSGDTIIWSRTWTATDGCNPISNTQNIKILDTMAPEISLQDTFVYNTGDFVPDSCGVFVTLDLGAAITDCNADLGLNLNGVDTNSLIIAQYFPVGVHNFTVTARDKSNNTTTKTIVLDVNDTSNPTVVCVGNRTISLGTGGTGVLQINDVFSSATDNCDSVLSISDATLSQSVFDCSDLGTQQVTLSVTDGAGNVGECTVNVEVINGSNTSFIDIEASATDETIGGAADGSVTVTVTGGSGNLSYLWNDVNASTTQTVNNLPAGLYMVVVNDLDNGCRLTDTVRVSAGTTVNYQICDGIGMQGDIVQIPIKVNNFNDILSIDMDFEISNTGVAQFISTNKASGFNLADVSADDFTYISPSRMLFAINLNPTSGETLPDGTVIFNLNLQVVGAGGTAVISAGGNSVATIETTALINNSATVIASSATTGTITAGTAPAATFSGNISTVANNPLPDVTVTLSGDATGTSVTDAAGDYTLPATAGQSLTVTPAEDRKHVQGVNVLDLATIQNHILKKVVFTSPYQYIAADVSGNGIVSVTDLAEIQGVILGRPTFFTAPSWKFIPADFSVANITAEPFDTNFPSSISDVSENADFIGVKMGDVNSSATTVELQSNGEAKARESFKFGLEDRVLKVGEIIEVPFKADNFEEVYAYQMTLNANPEWLSFEGIQAGELTGINSSNVGLQEVERGLISTLWFAAEPQNIEQNATLFTISFRVNKGGRNLSDILRASSDRLDAAAYTTDALPKNISLAFDTHTALEGFELFQNKPNPFSTQTTISFSIPKATTATLRFYDFSGRRVYQIKGDYAQGINNVVVHKNDLAGSGVLYYEIETPTFTARKKMILLD